MDLQKRAKIQGERDFEPSKSVGVAPMAGDPPPIPRQDDSVAEAQDSDAERLEKIRERAYAIWLDEGQADGRDQEH